MENWTWGLSLTALTIIIHATGIAVLAFAVRRIRTRMQGEGTRWRALTILIAVIGAVGLLLAVLHGIEAGIWATAYWWLGALPLPQEALLYSVDSITTRGASGLMLERGWRMMGALEAADGMFADLSSVIKTGDRSQTGAERRPLDLLSISSRSLAAGPDDAGFWPVISWPSATV
jgi:hypothetical protein